MPVVLWPIQPTSIYRDNKFTNVEDILQGQRVHSLFQILIQFENITSNVTDIFSELYDEISKISTTTAEISNRLQAISERVKSQDTSANIFKGMKMDWKLKIAVGAPTVHRSTIPEPMDKMYQSCVSMPNFQKIERFNKGETSCAHKYSNPGFFMEQWITDLDKEVAIKREKRMQRRDKKRKTVRMNTSNEGINKQGKAQATGSPTKLVPESQRKEFRQAPAPEKPRSSPMKKDSYASKSDLDLQNNEEIAQIPEPPKPMDEPLVSAIPMKTISPMVSAPPPPPCAPQIEILQVTEPVVCAPSAPAPPVPTLATKQATVVPAQPPTIASSKGGMDLLSSIRAGKSLKKVEAVEEKKVDSYQGNDVAAILARRIMLADDSDGSDDGDEEDDEGDWD